MDAFRIDGQATAEEAADLCWQPDGAQVTDVWTLTRDGLAALRDTIDQYLRDQVPVDNFCEECGADMPAAESVTISWRHGLACSRHPSATLPFH